MARILIGAIAAIILASGCASISPPIRLDGPRTEVQALAGQWSGDYTSDGSRARRGLIAFTLVEGEDHAHGDVLMIPEGFSRAYERYYGDEPRTKVLAPPESLSIRLVRVGDGQVSGVLEPYWDPDRECQARTTFLGHIRGRTIEGTFRSTYSKPLGETTGQWKVTRHR